VARLITCGWETANASEATGQNNFANLTVQTSPTRNADSGYSMKIPSTMSSGAIGFEYPYESANSPAITDTWYARFYLYFTAAPTAAHKFFGMNATGLGTPTWPNTGIELMLNTDRTLTLYMNNVAQSPASSALGTSTWHRIEVRGISGTSGAEAELKVNGTSVVSASGSTGQNAAFIKLQFGSSSASDRGVDLYIDDLALNDSTGSDENTWLGDTYLKILTAVGDSSIGAGWTTSGAATTNLYTNIDNMPPIGVADTTANEGRQIRNATSNANSAYDATLTSYSTAGLSAADTINMVQVVVAVGAPVSTQAKQGTTGCVSNPAGSFGGFIAAAGTSGAFWAGVAAGTYAAGWKTSLGPPVYGDIASGNRGTGPVVRVNQVTSSTRIALCCFVGLYVDYTPGTAAALLWKPNRGPNYRR
jgi:hypothetical protein